MRYVAAVGFPIRVAWRFVRGYPESARITKAILKCLVTTYQVWRKMLAPKMGPDVDRNGKLIWDVAGSEWVTRLEECGGFRILVVGNERIARDRRYVVAVNHCSTLDILAVTKAVPNGMFVVRSNVAKSRYPIISRAVKRGGQIVIEPGDTAQATRAIEKGMSRRPQANLVFFVEGTRSPDGRIGQFKKGAFRVAIDKGLPLLPLVISGSYRALPKGTLLGFRRGSTIYVECLDPIETAGMTQEDVPALMERTRGLMTSTYYSYSCNPRPQEGEEAPAVTRGPDIETHDERVLRPFI
jgi:1-acyl-sn-glycerol-3-phosphate acyltransferase